MKFVAISDTHGRHAGLQLPVGDVLIHAGDVSMKGDEAAIDDFLHWFAEQKFQHKIFIAGNHDFYFERTPAEIIAAKIPAGITYLNDSGVTINGIHIWGSPISPWFYNWAFNRHRGEEIKRHWDLIPSSTAILITHGPVFKILDKTSRGQHVGCEDLMEKVNIIQPKVHICGHIHEAYGTLEQAGINYINASVLNEKYALVNEPISFSL